MDILLIGSGGREHAIAKKILENKSVNRIFCAPGNGGTNFEEKCENVNLKTLEQLKEFALEKNIDLTIVGPEEPLINGIVDSFKESSLRIFGPSRKAAMLEGSKSFSKDFMKKYGVKTASYEVFENSDLAIKYLETVEFPIVVKADGLAAGKGVYICDSFEEGEKAIKDIMVDDIFNGAGNLIVIEEFLEGFEASILSITDGRTILPFISAKDHKQIYDGGKGPNTGGMGVIAPNPYVTEEILKDFKENIMDKTLAGIKEEKFDYKGIIFFGVMVTKKGCYLLEYNVRMGDPETQSVLKLMDSDLLDLINEAINGNLKGFDLQWKKGYCCNVVLASGGYPMTFNKGYEIIFEREIKDSLIFAGAEYKENILKTSGGRVLSVLGVGETREEAIIDSYNKVKKVSFKDSYCRKDIGK
ncbi:MAG: phosphoribosylamine--glycine ligase [Sarcina sp.]